MSDATFYNWRTKFGGMDASLMKRLKELEEENRRLKKVYAEEKLIAEIAREAIEKSGEAISAKRDGTANKSKYGVSIRVACLTFNISETCYR